MDRIFLIPALSAALVLSGCTTGRTLKSVHSHEFSESFALAEGRTDSLSIEMEIECPESGSTEQALKNIKSTIKTAVFGEGYTVLDIEDGFRTFADNLAKDYRETNLDLLEKIGDEKEFGGMNLGWEYLTTGEFTGSHEGYTTYTVTKYSYTGGAHGMQVTTSYVFDLSDGHVVEESELFRDDYKPLLSAMLTSHVRDNAEDPESIVLFVSEVEPNGNFGISGEGVTYIYNPYDIAPYSSGTIRIFIPWKELKPILK